MTFGVLAVGQPLSSSPSEFLPKHLARRLVKRGWADPVSKTVIRRRAHRAQIEPEAIEPCLFDFAPGLPPLELPGLIFEAPGPQKTPQHPLAGASLDPVAPGELQALIDAHRAAVALFMVQSTCGTIDTKGHQ